MKSPQTPRANVAKRVTKKPATPRGADAPVRTLAKKKLAVAVGKAAKAPVGRNAIGLPAPKPSRRMRPAEVREMFSRLREANPAPKTELEYSTPYELLVAVTLSAQSTDVGVNKATRHLFPVANTPEKIARLGEAGLKRYISTIGLYNTKAANVVAMAKQLIELHGGNVPRDRDALEALPGVGRKTANVVLNTAFGEPTMAVDTHIFRVSNRTGLAPGANVRAVEDGLVAVIPDEFMRDAHHWLILHGRYVCKARVPDCPRCIVRDLCHFPDKTPGAAPPLEAAPGKAESKRRRA